MIIDWLVLVLLQFVVCMYGLASISIFYFLLAAVCFESVTRWRDPTTIFLLSSTKRLFSEHDEVTTGLYLKICLLKPAACRRKICLINIAIHTLPRKNRIIENESWVQKDTKHTQIRFHRHPTIALEQEMKKLLCQQTSTSTAGRGSSFSWIPYL